MRIAKPILLVTTPVGVAFGLREAWRLAGPKMAVLMAVLLAVVGAFVWWTVRTIRRERLPSPGLRPTSPASGRGGES